MGAAKNKTRRFLNEHPKCCFCGGIAPSTSIDHIPARTCFVGRQYPETFEFPACQRCQEASRLDELAFAFYVRALDGNPANFDEKSAEKMITGLANNLPHLLPNPFIDGRRKRVALRKMGLSKPDHMLARQIPVIEINPELHERMDRYTRKIACAIYYREQGRIATAEHRVVASWGLVADRVFMKSAEGFINMTPLITIGKRINVDIGDQFGYRCNKCDAPDVMAVLAAFGQGVVLQILIADPASASGIGAMDHLPDTALRPVWKRVIDNYPHT
jgi:hypothetical protein